MTLNPPNNHTEEFYLCNETSVVHTMVLSLWFVVVRWLLSVVGSLCSSPKTLPISQEEQHVYVCLILLSVLLLCFPKFTSMVWYRRWLLHKSILFFLVIYSYEWWESFYCHLFILSNWLMLTRFDLNIREE